MRSKATWNYLVHNVTAHARQHDDTPLDHTLVEDARRRPCAQKRSNEIDVDDASESINRIIHCIRSAGDAGTCDKSSKRKSRLNVGFFENGVDARLIRYIALLIFDRAFLFSSKGGKSFYDLFRRSSALPWHCGY
jgi:hypothetical protein